MVLATVPEAPPTRRNHRATSCPAPISAKEPKIVGSRLRVRALWCASSWSAGGMMATLFEIGGRLHDRMCRGDVAIPTVVSVAKLKYDEVMSEDPTPRRPS